jgi:hypothetical protein
MQVVDKRVTGLLYALEAVGAVFVGFFLVAYVAGLFVIPQTTVFHSEPFFKIPLTVFGVLFLVLTACIIVFAAMKRKA